MMYIYKLFKWSSGGQVIKRSDEVWIPFDPANTDYINFKNEILNDQAELQDTEGAVMTPEAAKEFVRTLP